jgi:hypothetical protein
MVREEKDRTQQKDINFVSEVAAAVGAGVIHGALEADPSPSSLPVSWPLA